MAAALQSPLTAWPQDRIGTSCADAVRFLRRLHKADDAVVALARKIEGTDDFEALGNILVADCDTMLSGIWPMVRHDVYWTLSSVYKDARVIGQHRETRLPITWRRLEQLQHINACWVDLDCYKTRTSPAQAYGSALNYLLEHGLPLPAWEIFSGQGLWLLWEFHQPVRAYREKCDLLLRINSNLVDRLKHLGADDQSRDAARVCRIPGSVNSKNGEPVFYQEIAGSSLVDMEQFAALLGVPVRKTPLDGERVRKHRALRNPAKVAAGYARWQTRRADLLQVVESRGRIRQGGNGVPGRKDFLFVFTAVSMKAGLKGADIRHEVYDLGQNRCTPPLSDVEVEIVLSQGLRAKKHISDSTLKAKAAITAEEIESLGLNLGRTNRQPGTRSKRVEIANRHRAIVEILKAGHVSIREMAALLRLRGFSVAREIVRRDYQKLGIVREPEVASDHFFPAAPPPLPPIQAAEKWSARKLTAKKLTKPKSRESTSKKAEIAARRDAILDLAEAETEGVTTRRMAELLKARGFAVSHVIVSKDYKALGIMGPRTPRRAKFVNFCAYKPPSPPIQAEKLTKPEREPGPEPGGLLPTFSLNGNRNEPKEQQHIFGHAAGTKRSPQGSEGMTTTNEQSSTT